MSGERKCRVRDSEARLAPLFMNETASAAYQQASFTTQREHRSVPSGPSPSTNSLHFALQGRSRCNARERCRVASRVVKTRAINSQMYLSIGNTPKLCRRDANFDSLSLTRMSVTLLQIGKLRDVEFASVSLATRLLEILSAQKRRKCLACM